MRTRKMTVIVVALAGLCLATMPAQAIESKVACSLVIHAESEWAQLWADPQQGAAYFGRVNDLVSQTTLKGVEINFQTPYLPEYSEQIKALANMGVEIDPHWHTGAVPYNGADVAQWLEGLGIKDQGVVGGYLESQQLGTTETALNSRYVRQNQILWGEGTSQHVADASSTGIRLEGGLIHIGGSGLDQLATVERLLAENPQDQLYTISVTVLGPINSVQTVYILDVIDQINATLGNACYWANLGQVAEDWKSYYETDSYREW